MAVEAADPTADEVVAFLQSPSRLWSRTELMLRPSPIPQHAGVYGWYFNELPWHEVPGIGTHVGDWSLLYVGIAPGRPGSRSNLRKRLRSHLSGNARGSTLRLSLACLLMHRLGLSPTQASGKIGFGSSEVLLTKWIDEHARVAWIEHSQPWVAEAAAVQVLGVPLNRDHNHGHPFHDTLGNVRRSVRDPHGSARAGGRVHRPPTPSE